MQRTAALLTALVLVTAAALWLHRGELVERVGALLPEASPTPLPSARDLEAGEAFAALRTRAVSAPVRRDGRDPRRFDAVDALPQLWIEPGDRLLARPESGAPLVAESDRYANVKVLVRRDGWVRVRWRSQIGWMPEPPEPEPPAPVLEPVRPVAAAVPDAARLAAARRLLGAEECVARVGPYALYTDSRDAAALLLLDRAAASVEEAYRERYGLAPLGEPAEAVVLFRRRAGYLDLIAQAGGPGGGTGHVTSGVVALWREGRDLDEVRATLVHELAHLLNRRALGPGLPPWLDEGIAVDLAESRFGEGGRLLPGTLNEVARRTSFTVEWLVAGASRHAVEDAASRGALPALSALTASPESFAAVEPQSLGYAQAGFLVRFLLAGEHAPGFRRFLAGVAEGGDPSGAGLLAALELGDFAVLERGLGEWLRGEPASDLATASP